MIVNHIPLYIYHLLMATDKIILLLLLCVLAASQSNMYKLQLLPTDRGARCLDGSPYAIYLHMGSGANRNKTIIYMNSGGFCEGFTLEQTL